MFSDCTCFSSSKYKWLILAAGCVTMFLRAIFISGTLPVLSIYYNEKYTDRKLASMISSIQTATGFVGSFPAMLLCRKLIGGKVQIIGGVFSCAGMIGAAFSTQAWQALISNGIVTGIGSACLYAGCYNAVSGYFTGHQLVPYVAMALAYSVGTMATPLILQTMIGSFGYRDSLIVCGGFMLLNLVTGIIHRPPSKDTTNTNTDPTKNRKRSLMFQDRRKGSFIMNTVSETIDSNPNITANVDRKFSHSLPDDSIEDGADNTNLTDGRARKSPMMFIYEHKMAINYVIAAFCSYAGYVAYMGNLGEYAMVELKLSENDYSQAITALGAARLVSGVIYMLVSRYFILSSVCMYSASVLLQAVIVFSLTAQPDTMTFYILMGLAGVLQQLYRNAMYGCCMDITSPSRAPYMYMIQTLFDGCGSTAGSVIAAYLQVEVSIKAGIYFAGGIMVFSSLVLLPTALATLRAPKVYKPDDAVALPLES